MKRYKLLKDLPTFKAGDEFFISKSGNLIAGTPEKPKKVLIGDGDFVVPVEVDLMAYAKETLEQFPNILTDWFEEINTNFWVINKHGRILEKYHAIFEKHNIDNLKSIGNYFETEEQAKKHLKWLKARVVLLEDTKGFKPDWSYGEQEKYFVCYDYGVKRLDIDDFIFCKYGEICFKTHEDAEKSIAKHEKEWKIYLGIEE